MSVVSGDSQSVAVTDTLPDPIKVQVTRDGKPVKQQLVDWHVVEQNAGEPFVTTTETGTDGATQNRLTAGTWASTRAEIDGPAHLQVRWVNQNTGEAIVDTTVTFLILPGPADSVIPNISYINAASPFTIPAGVVTDQYGNPVPIRVASDSIAASDSATLTYASPGCGPFTVTVADTTVAGGIVEAGGLLHFTFTSQDAAHIGYWIFRPDGTTTFHDVSIRSDPSSVSANDQFYPCWQGVVAPGDTVWKAR